MLNKLRGIDELRTSTKSCKTLKGGLKTKNEPMRMKNTITEMNTYRDSIAG